MSDLTASEEKRQCEWCKEAIRSDALKCPHCGKWRKDIDLLKKHVWGTLAMTLVPLAVGFMAFLVAAKRHTWWHKQGSSAADVFRGIDPIGDFSLSQFLTSVSGWVLILCVASWVVLIVMVRRYERRAKAIIEAAGESKRPMSKR